ncbi:sugar-binding protein, partial [Candidatus Latescibacterota bacterium]
MKKICSFTLLLFFAVICNVSGIEILNTSYINGLAPMSIDGNLDDWEGIQTNEIPVIVPVMNVNNPRQTITPTGSSDLSGSFMCFADNRYVYFAVTVIDENLVIDSFEFSKGFKNDSVTVYYDGDLQDISKPYFDANDGMIKVIAELPDNVAYMEGIIPYLFEVMVPYFWEARGVKAGFKQNDDGYSVEIAIPLSILGWDGIQQDKTMGLNVRIHDMDQNADVETTDSGLIWAQDPDNTSWWMTESYNRVVFSEEISIPGEVARGGLEESVLTIGSESRELELILNTPDYSDGDQLLTAVLHDLENKDWESAESKLGVLENVVWAQPMLGIIHFEAGEYESGVDILHDFALECPDDFAVKWAGNYPKMKAWLYFDTVPGIEKSYESGPAKAASILHYYLNLNPD